MLLKCILAHVIMMWIKDVLYKLNEHDVNNQCSSVTYIYIFVKEGNHAAGLKCITGGGWSMTICLDSTITVALLQYHHENDTCCMYLLRDLTGRSWATLSGDQDQWSYCPPTHLGAWTQMNTDSEIFSIAHHPSSEFWTPRSALHEHIYVHLTQIKRLLFSNHLRKVTWGKCVYCSAFSFAVQVAMSPFLMKTAMRTLGRPK